MDISKLERFKAIDKLIQESIEKENLEIELKNSEKLRNINKDKRKEIAYEIIALANRHGGKLIFGVNDNGTYEGKNIFKDDIDINKQIIRQKYLVKIYHYLLIMEVKVI